MKKSKLVAVIIVLLVLPLLLQAQIPATVAYKYNFFTQEINISRYAGKPFRLSAGLKVKGRNDQSAATIFTQIKLMNGKTGFHTDPSKTMSTDSNWKTVALKGTIDTNAAVLVLGGYSREKVIFSSIIFNWRSNNIRANGSEFISITCFLTFSGLIC